MKSLLFKDLFNISHNIKSLFFMLLFFAVMFVPSQGLEEYIVISSLLCSMMTLTTFSFDESCKWTKYALITPVTREDIVNSKFMILLIFACFGVLNGLILGGLISLIWSFYRGIPLPGAQEIIVSALLGLLIGMLQGSTIIPLMYHFGTEKARMLSLMSIIIPASILLAIYKIMESLGWTNSLSFILLAAAVLCLVWIICMHRISLKIFRKQEM